MRITGDSREFAEPHRRGAGRPFVRTLLAAVLVLFASGPTAWAGDLDIFEASVGPGGTRAIGAPATDVPLDIDYSPQSAEGGGLFGFSQMQIVTTGDVTLTTSGFLCAAASCLYYPLPFSSGNSILITAGDDLNGEVAATHDLMTISVSGSNGFIVLLDGNYLDATGTAGAPGAVQTVDSTTLAVVPEPGVALGLTMGGLTLSAVGRRRSTRRSSQRIPDGSSVPPIGSRARLERLRCTISYDSDSIRSIGTRACFASSSGTTTRGPSFFRQS